MVGVPAALKCLPARAQHCACDGGVKAVWPVDAEPVLIHFDEVSKSVVGEARGGGGGLEGVGVGRQVPRSVGLGRLELAGAPVLSIEVHRLEVVAAGRSGPSTSNSSGYKTPRSLVDKRGGSKVRPNRFDPVVQREQLAVEVRARRASQKRVEGVNDVVEFSLLAAGAVVGADR